MKLQDLLSFDDIIIQCHDNPDADAIASGFALWKYLSDQGKCPHFLYSGRKRISKPNLNLMLALCNIPLEHRPSPADIPEAELLVNVDCQPGERNVTALRSRNRAVIDHQTVPVPKVEVPPQWKEIRGYGSCSTILWDMLCDAGYEKQLPAKLCTALYYGLYMDTNYLKRMQDPMDQKMISALDIDSVIFDQLKACNFSQEEVITFGKALANARFDLDDGFAVVEAPPCDPNILGAVSDQMMEVQFVEACVVYSILSPDCIKLSIRSYNPEIPACKLLEHLAIDFSGGGGGTDEKAAGTLTGGAALESLKADERGLSGALGRLIYTRTSGYLA